MSDIPAVAETVNLLLLVITCVVLHVRLRNRASLSMLLALAAIVLWTLSAPAIPTTAVVVDVPPIGTGMNAREALDTFEAVDSEARPREAVGIAFHVWFCVSCLLAVISIPRRRAAG